MNTCTVSSLRLNRRNAQKMTSKLNNVDAVDAANRRSSIFKLFFLSLSCIKPCTETWWSPRTRSNSAAAIPPALPPSWVPALCCSLCHSEWQPAAVSWRSKDRIFLKMANWANFCVPQDLRTKWRKLASIRQPNLVGIGQSGWQFGWRARLSASASHFEKLVPISSRISLKIPGYQMHRKYQILKQFEKKERKIAIWLLKVQHFKNFVLFW